MSEPDEPGFGRPKTEPLPGSVKPYGRHVLVCTGRAGWPAHVDQDGGFIQALAAAIEARSAEMPLAVKLNACDEPSREPNRGGAFDLLILPDGVRYLGLREDQLPVLVDEHLVGDRVAGLPHEETSGRYVCVCVHEARDARCGVCGPPVAHALEQELARRGLRDVRVVRTSHVGGHQYAANVLIYPEGDWYGYVTPQDAPRIVEAHILRGEVVADLWRGRLGLTREEQLRAAATGQSS